MECYSEDGQGRLCVYDWRDTGGKANAPHKPPLVDDDMCRDVRSPRIRFTPLPDQSALASPPVPHPAASGLYLWVWFSLKLINAALNHQT
jgi:hypothetical protein